MSDWKLNNPFIDADQSYTAEFKALPLPDDTFGFDPVIENGSTIASATTSSKELQHDYRDAYSSAPSNDELESILFDLGISDGSAYQNQEQSQFSYSNNEIGINTNDSFTRKHTRKLSGSAIFGYIGTGADTQLAIPGLPPTPVTIHNKKPIYQDTMAELRASYAELNNIPANSKPSDQQPDYYFTGSGDGSYKFPKVSQPQPIINNYSVQDLKQLRQTQSKMNEYHTPFKVKNTFMEMKTPTPQATPSKLSWTPTLITKKNSVSEQIIKEQSIRSPTRKKKPTITSTLETGALDYHFVGPDDDDMYWCKFENCGKPFTRISNIRAHIQTHLSDRPFTCDVCHKAFVRNHDLRRHYKGHQEYEHACPCGKKFPRQDALKRHRIRNICIGSIPDEKGIHQKKTANSQAKIDKAKKPKAKKVDAETKERLVQDLNLMKQQEKQQQSSDTLIMDSQTAAASNKRFAMPLMNVPAYHLSSGIGNMKEPYMGYSSAQPIADFSTNIDADFSFNIDDYASGFIA
ncbi:hypothetical protein CANARDRAFT_232688 [[Candida] arabinofermentans NRRL YB-2248]|uniref:C2H2-type domain-containing protein n=1 Tax=[Candida] arabinofermentans NRRL YB-2248 TaxID=983967 RepID=A0A1E4T272_9ASCO|nr:hypothetical protein CANARDRAFT_232688 [[Candida] arabinofermentans NRRL YB-2248]